MFHVSYCVEDEDAMPLMLGHSPLAESLVEAFDSSKGLIKVQAGAPLEPLKYSSGSAQGASTQTQGSSKLNATYATQSKNASTQQMPASRSLFVVDRSH